MRKIKNNLRILMARDKMTMKELHKRTGLSERTISKLYHEESTTIGFDTIIKICEVFDCKVGDLLYLENAPKD